MIDADDADDDLPVTEFTESKKKEGLYIEE